MSLSPTELAAVLANPAIKIDNLYGVGGSPGFFGTGMGGLLSSSGGLGQTVGAYQDDKGRLQTGGSFSPGGQASAISAVLGATGATETAAGKAAIDRLTNQADRQACNQSGGFTTQGGECLTGDVALQRIDEILSNPNAPSVLVNRADEYVARNDEDNSGDISTEEAANIDPNYAGTPDDVDEPYLEAYCAENPDDFDCQGIGDDELDPDDTTVVTAEDLEGILEVW